MSDIDVKALREVLATMPALRRSEQSDGLVVVNSTPPVAFLSTHASNRYARDSIADRVVAVLNSASALLDRVEALEAEAAKTDEVLAATVAKWEEMER